MATHVPFTIFDKDGQTIVTVVPSGSANGVAEWSNMDAPRSQRYVVTASVRTTGNDRRRYTVKVSVPKVDTQTVNGVDLPVTAWRALCDLTVTIPVFASQSDSALIVDAISSTFGQDSPISEAIRDSVGFF